MVELLDITSDGLKQQGVTVKKEASTIAVYSDKHGSRRFTIFKNDWTKTEKQIDKGLHDSGFPQIIISAVLLDMSNNYDKIMNGKATTKRLEQEKAAAETTGSKNGTKGCKSKLFNGGMAHEGSGKTQSSQRHHK